MKILILGISGMLGHKAFERFSFNEKFEVYGTLKNGSYINKYFSESKNSKNIFSEIDALDLNTVTRLIDELSPDIILNCIGIVKQIKEAKNPLLSIEINSLFPHKIASYIENSKTRLIHISTDCVFSGVKGNYLETDHSDANDLYGKTKFLGELKTYKNSITLRTSIIGPELKGRLSLLEWFLNTKKEVNGFTNAIYSGFTTLELTNIIENYVILNPNISGLFNVSSDSISKHDLLNIIAKVYKKNITIKPFGEFKSDKSLNGDLFKETFAFNPKSWEEMIVEMYNSKNKTNNKKST